MKINDDGLELIKQFESCRLEAYQDIVGILTIGFGHTGTDVTPGMEIDRTTAEAILCEDLDKFERGVEKRLKVKVNSNEFSALVCLAFNIGLGNFGSSTLLKLLNSGDFSGAAGQFERWSKAGGQTISGLVRRRKAERDLFLS